MDKERKEYLRSFIIRGGYEPLRNCVQGKQLRDLQIAGVMFALLWKKCVIAADTGYGKTIIAAALTNLVIKDKKVLFILKRFTLDSIYSKITESIRNDLSVGFITDQQEVIERMVFRNRARNNQVLIISSDAIANPYVNKYLYDNREDIQMVFVDEVHLFANFESVESRLIAKLIEHAEYAYLLSATPFERDIQQLIDCCYYLNHDVYKGLNPKTFGNQFRIYENGKFRGYRDVERLKKILAPMMFVVSRPDTTVCTIHKVRSKPSWRDIEDYQARKVIKLDTTGEPYFKLLQLVFEYTSQGKKGLIYANFNDVKRMLYERLTKTGYKVGVVDGTVSKELGQDRETTSHLFNEGHYQLLITNRSVSLDQECDFVIFYEATQQYLQVIGRANRQMKQKQINVDIILATQTYDEKFFMDNAYPKIYMIAKVLDKDISGLEGAMKCRTDTTQTS